MMIKTMFFSGLFLFLTSPANAALVTLDGGTLEAAAIAGGPPDEVSDRPDPATPQLGFTSVSAEAAGIYISDEYSINIPEGSWPVNSSATASVDAVQNASGGLDLQLSAFANASSLWYGAGTWVGAGSGSSASVLISVAGPTRMVLDLLGDFGLQSDMGAGFNGNGVHWNFNGFVPYPPFDDPNPFGDEPSTTLLLQAGQYKASVSASANADSSASILTLSLTPVPVPAAFWLLGSALAGCIGFVRRHPVEAL